MDYNPVCPAWGNLTWPKVGEFNLANGEQTAFPAEVCEAALAHTVRDATEAAYFRSDLYEKRRDLMDAWAAYCQRKSTLKGSPACK